MTAAQDERLKAILDGGPGPRTRSAHYAAATSAGSSGGVVYTAGGILLRRLDYSSLKPRPRHRKNDPVEAARFEQRAPFLRGR